MTLLLVLTALNSAGLLALAVVQWRLRPAVNVSNAVVSREEAMRAVVRLIDEAARRGVMPRAFVREAKRAS